MDRKDFGSSVVIRVIACLILSNFAAVNGKANEVSVALEYAMELGPSVSLQGKLLPSQVFVSQRLSGKALAETPLLQLRGESSCRYRTATIRGGVTFFTEDHRWTKCGNPRAFLHYVYEADMQESEKDTTIIVDIQNYGFTPPEVTLRSMCAIHILWYRTQLAFRGLSLSHALINKVPAHRYAPSRWVVMIFTAVPILLFLAFFERRGKISNL